MQRKGLALYSARHTFKGFIDDLANLSERSRRIVMGHSTAINTPGGYGPKTITEEQAEVILGLSNRTIKRMADLLIGANDKAQRGQLKIIDVWRNDERSNDEKLQTASRGLASIAAPKNGLMICPRTPPVLDRRPFLCLY
jgi:hypothetical protein